MDHAQHTAIANFIELTAVVRARFRNSCDDEPLANHVDRVAVGSGPHLDYNALLAALEADADKHHVKLAAKRLKLLQTQLAAKDVSAQPLWRGGQ